MAPLGVDPKWRIQEQGDSLDSRLAPKDTPSGLNISALFPPRCVKGGNTPHHMFGSLQVHLQTHQAHSNFHISHEPPWHENPLNNIPFDNLKHRRKNKYLATSQEVDNFEFLAYEYTHYHSSIIHLSIH